MDRGGLTRGARKGRERARARPPTIRQLAAAAGLSLSTVARAASTPEKVRAETRAAIARAAERIGYTPNLTARALIARRSQVIALVLPALNNSLWAEAAQGVADECARHGYHILVGSVLDQAATLDAEDAVVRTLVGRRPDGIVLTAMGHSPRVRRLLRGSGMPVVEIGDQPDRPIDMAVGPSNIAAARDLARALRARGYRRIGFMCGGYVGNELMQHRRAGYLDGVERGADLIVECEVPVTLDRAGVATAAILARDPAVDALICSGDYFAHGALLWCLRHRVAVPQRVAIAGMGDLELSARLAPALSTVRFDGYAIGRRAAVKLIARLDGGREGPAVEVTPHTLMLREST